MKFVNLCGKLNQIYLIDDQIAKKHTHTCWVLTKIESVIHIELCYKFR